MYAKGIGVDVDIKKAKYWLRTADKNDVKSC
jgi:TPR repeat protein